jgi:hypothetical protein
VEEPELKQRPFVDVELLFEQRLPFDEEVRGRPVDIGHFLADIVPSKEQNHQATLSDIVTFIDNDIATVTDFSERVPIEKNNPKEKFPGDPRALFWCHPFLLKMTPTSQSSQAGYEPGI